jgi:hypothetical protein
MYCVCNMLNFSVFLSFILLLSREKQNEIPSYLCRFGNLILLALS